MINPKEIILTIAIAVVLGITISLLETWNLFLTSLILVFIILALNIIAKKAMAYYLDSEIEVKLWNIERYGFRPGQKFKRPFPAGVFVPIIFSFITLGTFKWMASLVFDVKAKVHRAAKRHGLWSFSEMTEYHIGLIAASGIGLNLLAAAVGYLINQPEFSKLNIYYAFFNMLPISDLDGNKIFFGSRVIWTFLAVITLVGTFYALFLV